MLNLNFKTERYSGKIFHKHLKNKFESFNLKIYVLLCIVHKTLENNFAHFCDHSYGVARVLECAPTIWWENGRVQFTGGSNPILTSYSFPSENQQHPFKHACLRHVYIFRREYIRLLYVNTLISLI
jgi:hypothetical protein